MNRALTIERLGALRGAPVYDSAGEKIGKVDEIYYDMDTREPEWIGLGTGMMGKRKKHVVAPVAGAEAHDHSVYIGYGKDKVKDSPQIDSDEIEPGLESSLYDYYGIEHSTRNSDTILPDETGGTEAPPPATGAEGTSMTRKEEELTVGTRPVEAGRVRLRKWVETEPVDADVALTRERAFVERERIDEPVSEHEFGEAEVEMPLHAEEAVVQKQTVARERISLGKETEREDRTVQDTLRKERVEVDEDVD